MIRKCTPADINSLMEIYNDAVKHTTATYDLEEKSLDDRKQWFAEHEEEPYLILADELDGRITGYASLSRYRDRKAFDRTVEISIYIHKDFQKQGIGTHLMEATLAYASEHPQIHTVIALITGDNARSIALHEKFGFVFTGQLQQVGYKFGRWLDLNSYQIIYEEMPHG